jgi:two-component system, NarL family, response regulator DegU
MDTERLSKLVLYCQNPIALIGFRQMVEADGAYQFTPAYKAEEAVELTRLIRPDLLVLDMDSCVDLPLLRDLKHLVPDTRVIVWVGPISPEMALQSVNLGAVAIIPKTTEPQSFLKSLREVNAGGTSIERTLISGISGSRRVNLSKRESELVALIAQGLRNKEIAHRLSITENTVKAYLSRLFEKVKVDDRLGLALYGLTNLTNDIFAIRAKVGTRPEVKLPRHHVTRPEAFKNHTSPGSGRFVPTHP